MVSGMTGTGHLILEAVGPNNGHIRNAMRIGVWWIKGEPEWIDIRHKTAGWSFRLELPQREEETP